MSKKHVYDGRRWRVMVKFGRYRFGFGRMNGWSSFTWGLGFCCGNVVRRSVKRPAFVDICGASWNGLCGNDGLFLHRCARLTDHDGDHGCECGDNCVRLPDEPVVVDAARYLLRLGRPHASNAEVDRAVSSVIADPTYRDELARTVANGLLFDLRTAMSILDRHDEETANSPANPRPSTT